MRNPPRPTYQRLLKAVRAASGATHREAQLVWQRLGPWLAAHDRVSVAGVGRHPKKLSTYLALARGFVPPGWAVEISLQTKGGVYRRDERGRRRDPRPLKVKIITWAKKALPIAEHERAVRHASERGTLDKGFTFVVADWKKGTGRTANAGTIRKEIARELTAFYGALHHPRTSVRVNMVEEE